MTLQRYIAKRAFIFFVIIPTLISLVYFLGFAKATYETETKLIVRASQSGSNALVPGFAAALLGLGGSTSMEDAMILEEYLLSADFIELADAALDLRSHYKNARTDPFRRLARKAQAESFYRFFRKKVTVRVRPESGILTVQVRAFSPEVTLQFAQFIIQRSEEMVNEINDRMMESQTGLTVRELEKHKQRLHSSRQAMLTFQVENAIVDPVSESAARFGNIAALDRRLTEKQAELRAKGSYLREDAFELRVLRQEIAAMEAQRTEETRRFVTGGDTTMATLLKEYEALKIAHEFALNAYTAALAMAETATLEATRQEKFLLSVAHPHLPEKPAFPRPLRGTAVVFILAVALFAIGRLVVATIRDHTV
jgi:capsular polysaccharide transport system permease protein